MNTFTCYSVGFSATILLLVAMFPLNAITLEFNGENFVPNCSVVL
jgi:hypothetical protein